MRGRGAVAGPTVAAAFRQSVARLRAARLHYGHGTHDARDEAAFFILHLLDLPPQSLAPLADVRLTQRQAGRLRALIDRRIRTRAPAAYLLREAWLGGLRFYVDRRVIVPRSFIAELLREGLEPWVRGPVRQVLDLCTGCGCLAVAAAQAFPRARIDASDDSRPALAVARRNLALHRLRHRVRLVQSDLFAGLGRRRYDLIICNPPYVAAASMRRLPAEYCCEPRRALAGGHDGLDFVRRILEQGAGHLTARGLLVCEIGHNRAALERAYPRTPFLWPETSAGPGHVFMLGRADFPLRRDVSACRARATHRQAQQSTRPRAR
ncbi:MAG: 50S ribosomal protein L3 N(5)-glutamine methyltransferase [Burkholderiales bacterium]